MTETAEQPGRAVRKRPKDRADRILEAATRLFRERGYHDVGMADVGAEVGITGPAVYRHFRNKESLLVAVVERELARLVASVEESAELGTTPSEALERVDEALARGAIEERTISTMYVRDVRHAPFEARAGIRVLQRHLTRIWSDALRAVRPELSQEEAEYVVLTSYGVFSSHLFFESGLPRRRHERLLVEIAQHAQLAWEPPADRGDADRPTDGRRRPAGLPDPEHREPVAVTARASRREMVLQAAVGLFRRYGYRGVGIDEIGAAAGISGPGVYRHFKGKEDILLAAYQRAWEQMMAGITKALEGASSPRDAVARIITSYVDVAFDNADLVVVYLREDEHLPEEHHREIRRRQRAYIEEWVHALRAVDADLDEDETRVRVHAAAGIVNSAVDIPTRLPGEQVREMVAAMVSVVVLDPGAARS